jgi:signal transduction histidine kinase/CheY-like chemotaxis protein
MLRSRGGDRLASWSAGFARAAGAGAAAIGGLALVGWGTGLTAPGGRLFGLAPIEPGTAVFFVCCGLALALLADRPASGRRFLGLACAGLAAAWGTLHVVEYALAAHLDLDEIVFADLASLTDTPFTGGTSVWSVLLVGLLGWAPLLLNTRRHHWFGELFVVAPLAISFLSIVAEAFRPLTAIDRASALPTVFTFVLLEFGLLAARPGRGWMAILTGDNLGGSLARRLLPFAILVPFVTAWLRTGAELVGAVNKEAAGMLYALAIVLVQSVLILWYATVVTRMDRKRKEAEETVRSLLGVGAKLNSTLEVDSLLDILAREAMQLVGAGGGLAGLRTAEGMACHRYFRNGESVPFEGCWPRGHGLPGWVLDHGRPYLTNDARADAAVDPKLRERFDVRAAACTPILDSHGEVLGFFEVHDKAGGEFTDGDRERLVAVAQSAAVAIQNALAYRNLQEAQHALKEADRHKNEFLATLAHELRNPLAPIRNALHLLGLAKGDAAVAERARVMMERQVGQMVRLIDDLLDVSRITRGKLELRTERVELARVVESAVETCRPLIQASGHELTLALPAEPVHLEADGTRLAQVFANLLNNSAKYTPPGGRIALAAEVHSGSLVATVRDTGIGIPREMLGRVFDMFTQVDQTLVKTSGGLGIGLTLVKRLVEMHHGTIEAHSDGPGRGSTFVVRLPVRGGPPGTAPDAAPAKAGPAPAGRRRILIADDNADAATSLAAMLQLMGNDTRVAYDGLQALQEAETFRPDVILLDIGMPKLSGYDAARRIRQQPWGVRPLIVAITGWGQEDDKQRARAAGFDHHLTKPMDPTTLVSLLDAPRSSPTRRLA